MYQRPAVAETQYHQRDSRTLLDFVGANFFPFVFRFLTYLLSCILLLFALRYFVNNAPLLFVCKFRYSLLSRPYLLPVLRIY